MQWKYLKITVYWKIQWKITLFLLPLSKIKRNGFLVFLSHQLRKKQGYLKDTIPWA